MADIRWGGANVLRHSSYSRPRQRRRPRRRRRRQRRQEISCQAVDSPVAIEYIWAAAAAAAAGLFRCCDAWRETTAVARLQVRPCVKLRAPPRGQVAYCSAARACVPGWRLDRAFFTDAVPV